MKSLEALAKEMFVKFALKETGKRANWTYLSSNRKLEWMKDVFEIADAYMLELKLQLKPIPIGKNSATVYEAGMIDGIRAERVALHQMLDKIHVDLANQLIDAEQEYSKQKKQV